MAARVQEPLTGLYWLCKRLEPDYPKAAGWLRADHTRYFDATYTLWDFGRWQRTFFLAYLARFSSSGLLAPTGPSLGLGVHVR